MYLIRMENNKTLFYYLFCRFLDSQQISEKEQNIEKEREDRSMFVQELLLSTLTESLHLQDIDDLSNVNTETPKIPSDSLPTSAADVEPSPQQHITAVIPNQSTSSSQHKAAVTVSSLKPPVDKVIQANLQKMTQPTGGGGGGGGGGVTHGHRGQGPLSNTQTTRQSHGSNNSGQVYNLVPGPNTMPPQLGGAGIGAGNPLPLPGRPGSAGRDRDGRVNPAAAKKNMFKQFPTSQTSDREPPPH